MVGQETGRGMTGASFLTSAASFGDLTCFLVTSGGEQVGGVLATFGELPPDVAGLGDVPAAPLFVEAAESGELAVDNMSHDFHVVVT